MASVGSFEAKTHLSALLERVTQGEQITITKHGVPIAKIVPVSEQPQITPDEVIERILRFQESHTLGGLSVRELINEGRK